MKTSGMRYGTYTRRIAYGGFEYGFTFGAAANKEDAHTVGPCEIGDSEFDVVLGVAHSTEEIESSWLKYAWVAEAIMKASKLSDEVDVPGELQC